MNRYQQGGMFLNRDECQNIIDKVYAFAKWGYTGVTISSWLNGELRWARNRTSHASDRCDVRVSITRTSDSANASGTCVTNQTDDISLEAVVRAAERRCVERENFRSMQPKYNGWNTMIPLQRPDTKIWSDATYAVTPEDRSAVAVMLTESAEKKGMLSAGYLEMRMGSHASMNNLEMYRGDPTPLMDYQRLTQAQCSCTVRNSIGTGSGWAGNSSYDSSRINGSEITQRALDKCIKSINPVRIEPGRYTVILEPQAVYGLIEGLMQGGDFRAPLSRISNEFPNNTSPHPFWLAFDEALQVHKTKLGLKIIDERITVSHFPDDPDLGVVSQDGLKEITWIKNGVLTELHHDHEFARSRLQRLTGRLYRPGFRVSGGTTTIDEMIAKTERGLLVTRFSGVEQLDSNTMLGSGVTRDGLWLIEKGVVTKSLWNMRFTESPLFAFNQIDLLGIPQPIFRPVVDPYDFSITPSIVPAMKINDFSFTGLLDAI